VPKPARAKHRDALPADHDDASHAMHSGAQELGHEGRAGSGDHAVLKLWLRLLASTTQIEAEIRKRNRTRPLPYENQLPSMIPNSISI